MSVSFVRRRICSIVTLQIIGLGALIYPLPSRAAGDETGLTVIVDQAKIIKLPERVATIVVGNPLIADVSLQPGGMVIVTGKGYGSTNMIAMDRGGSVLADRAIQVEGPTDKLVTMYRGVERESYSCTPSCQRRVTLGDDAKYFDSALGQTGNFNSTVSGSSTPKP